MEEEEGEGFEVFDIVDYSNGKVNTAVLLNHIDPDITQVIKMGLGDIDNLIRLTLKRSKTLKELYDNAEKLGGVFDGCVFVFSERYGINIIMFLGNGFNIYVSSTYKNIVTVEQKVNMKDYKRICAGLGLNISSDTQHHGLCMNGFNQHKDLRKLIKFLKTDRRLTLLDCGDLEIVDLLKRRGFTLYNVDDYLKYEENIAEHCNVVYHLKMDELNRSTKKMGRAIRTALLGENWSRDFFHEEMKLLSDLTKKYSRERKEMFSEIPVPKESIKEANDLKYDLIMGNITDKQLPVRIEKFDDPDTYWSLHLVPEEEREDSSLFGYKKTDKYLAVIMKHHKDYVDRYEHIPDSVSEMILISHDWIVGKNHSSIELES